MLSIQPPSSCASSSASPPKFTPNILPCRVNASGPVSASKRFWNVESDEKGRKVAYFRGRKLLGREVRVHKDYRGVIVRQTERVVPRMTQDNGTKTDSSGMAPPEDDEEEEEGGEGEEPMKVLEEIGNFEEVIVWGHEQVPAGDDVFVRGMEEWFGFAEAMHGVGAGRAPTDAKAEG
ncbi:3'-5' exonuclease [Trapelia coarctata]|nr:3'-5' exonuclease [Trapelia coarctata]